ncbi:hypothetical protein THAOC_12527 [Thalassiosira oceanica]|uniref:Uncharacterized protein n=1 Tax=Thalassiosira oceanica TaxID=159749 RepID=K0SZT5_THAOC|nr:hypothetical protein THAOC_12527 [Thalassiosira oceanica]|eukprot:EJK66551.1 hypothetical protein THAOC_12527 [Thalassiosira oceanica]
MTDTFMNRRAVTTMGNEIYPGDHSSCLARGGEDNTPRHSSHHCGRSAVTISTSDGRMDFIVANSRPAKSTLAAGFFLGDDDSAFDIDRVECLNSAFLLVTRGARFTHSADVLAQDLRSKMGGI